VHDIESGVSRHYASYDVLSRIRAALSELGHDPDAVSPDVLKPVDEFHIGGAEATTALLEKLSIRSDTEVLDIGSGIGGPARMIAARYGCRVIGVDLTPHFVETARALSVMCGMDERVRFEVGSAVALPFPDASFDLALLLHVGMNVPDKAALFREARRVLREGGTFAVYEVMRAGDGDLAFPVPWAETPDLSALEPPQGYRDAAEAAGFRIVSEENRRDVALDFFARIQSRMPRPVRHRRSGCTT
jgi:SAM-dependent methyltransferase